MSSEFTTLGAGSDFGEHYRWNDVNSKTNVVKFFSSKTGKEKVLELPAIVGIIMQRKRDGLGTETHVFNHPDHKIRKVFKVVARECKIPYGQKVFNGWTAHDLRATGLTHLLETGVDLATVSKVFAQHTNLAETTRYLRPSKTAQFKAIQASDALVHLATTGGEQ